MIVAACGEPAIPGYSLETLPSGRRIAINAGPGSWSAEERWTARVALTIGRTDGTGPDVFGRIASIDVNAGGDIHVLERFAQEVRVFDANGDHRHTFGGPGEGPGQFTGAAGVNIAHDGNVWVWDPANRRFSIFDREGNRVRDIRRTIGGVVFPWGGDFDPAGNLIDWGLDYPQRIGTEAGGLVTFHPVRMNADGGALDSLPPLEHRPSVVEGGFWIPPMTTMTFHLDARGNVWSGCTGEYVLHRRTLEGDTTLTLSLIDAEPEPIPDAEIDTLIRELRDHAGRPGLDRSLIGTTRPVLTRIVTDGAGHLLVFPRLANHPEGTVVDVFREDNGEFLGRVDLPVRVLADPRPVATPGALYGITLGTLDVPLVVRIDLAPASSVPSPSPP